MNDQEWEKLRKKASKMANDEYASEASSILWLTKEEILAIVDEAEVDKDKLSELIAIVNDATKTNSQKAEAIRNITGLAEMVVPLIVKLL